MKPHSLLKSIFNHTMLWLLWYSINSISIFAKISSFGSSAWLQLAFNYLSLIAVFYAVINIMMRFFNRFSFIRYQSIKGHRAIFYLLKIEIFCVVLVVALYIAIAIFLDGKYFGYNYPDLFTHIDRRLMRVIGYVLFAAGYAYYCCYKRKQQQLAKANNKRLKKLQTDTHILKELYKQLTDEKSLN
jgi:hypothetical protein